MSGKIEAQTLPSRSPVVKDGGLPGILSRAMDRVLSDVADPQKSLDTANDEITALFTQ